MKIKTTIENETKLAQWLRERGGIAVWRNCDLSSPDIGQETYTPATHQDGTPATSPNWRCGNTPEGIITDAADVEIQTLREVKRVKIRRGPPYLGGVNRADRAKLDAALDAAGKGACYRECYDNMQYGSAWFEAVINVPSEIRPLNIAAQ